MTERSESTDTEEQIAEWQRHNARLLVELLEWKSGPVEVFRSILVESGWPSRTTSECRRYLEWLLTAESATARSLADDIAQQGVEWWLAMIALHEFQREMFYVPFAGRPGGMRGAEWSDLITVDVILEYIRRRGLHLCEAVMSSGVPGTVGGGADYDRPSESDVQVHRAACGEITRLYLRALDNDPLGRLVERMVYREANAQSPFFQGIQEELEDLCFIEDVTPEWARGPTNGKLLETCDGLCSLATTCKAVVDACEGSNGMQISRAIHNASALFSPWIVGIDDSEEVALEDALSALEEKGWVKSGDTRVFLDAIRELRQEVFQPA